MKTAERNYKAEIVSCSKELTKPERISIKDTSDATPIDQVLDSVPDTFFVIDVAYYAEIGVHNEAAKGDKDYSIYIIVDKIGTKYCTSSTSFFDSFMDIASEMDGDDFSVKVFRKPSKNYNGKYFISCSISL